MSDTEEELKYRGSFISDSSSLSEDELILTLTSRELPRLKKKIPSRPKSEEEELIFTEELTTSRELPKLKKRDKVLSKLKKTNKKERTEPFKFLESSSSSKYTDTDESSYEGGIEVDTFYDLSLKDQNSLYNSLLYLQNNRWEKFLRDPFIVNFFKPVQTVIESCGRQAKKNKTEGMWLLEWAGELEVKRLKKPILKSKCISCAEKSRDLTYAIYKLGSETPYGYIGSKCYERFSILENLVEIVKKAARKLKKYNYTPGTHDFNEFIVNPIIEAKDEIIEIPKEMSKYRNYKKN